MKKLTIVTLTYNQLERATKPYIESLYKYTNIEDFDLILVDNNSTDGTVEYLKELQTKYNNITLIFNDKNLGYDIGNNQGLKLIDTTGDIKNKFIGLFNNDLLFTPNWLEPCLKVFENDPKIGLASPRLPRKCKFDASNYLEHYEKFLEKYYKKYGEFQLNITPYFCVALIPVEVFKKVGFLDENFSPAFYEDDDYAIRTYYQGYKVGYINTSFVYHNHATTSKHLPEKDALMERNRKYFFEKHPIAEYIWKNRRTSVFKDMAKYIKDSFY